MTPELVRLLIVSWLSGAVGAFAVAATLFLFAMVARKVRRRKEQAK